jgi:outer membrane protein assembly factor BamB
VRPTENSTRRVSDPSPNHEVATAGNSWIAAPANYPCGLTWDGTYLWHSDQDAASIYAIDRTTGAVIRTFRCSLVRADLTFDGSMLCQVGGRPKRLVLVDPETGEVTGRREISPPSGRVTGVEIGPEGLWACLRAPTVVQLRDYPAMQVTREFAVPGDGPSGLTYADGLVVYGEYEAGMLHAIDSTDGSYVGSTRVDGRPTGIAWDGTRLWYCDFPGRVIRAIDRESVLDRF